MISEATGRLAYDICVNICSLYAAIFFVLSLYHIYWAFGGKIGLNFVIPSKNGEPLFTPTPSMTFAVAVGLFIAGNIFLGQMAFYSHFIPSSFFDWGMWGIFIIFLLRAIGDFNYVGFFKKHKKSHFALWDTRLFSPLCLFISFGALFINIVG